MEQRIHPLSDELISQIAAGEVIERPASVVKELVENSLDSGARWIAVELEEAGLKRIRVVDKGCGMSAVDAELAFKRHATSKIKDLEDLFAIRSLGFRGEALASIASIAHVQLRTRSVGARVGTQVELDAGKLLSVEEWAGDTGTEVVVTGLFHATPARKKYMKSLATEFKHCFDFLCHLSMAHSRVGFKLLKDGDLIFDLPADQDLKERIHALYGGSTAGALIPVQYHQSNLMIGGFIGKPELARSSRQYQFLFLNGRAIESRLIGRAVEDAFHSLMMTNRYPWFALDLNIDPTFVDVNVHPRKLEVKFVNTQEVYRAVFGSVQRALEKNVLSPKLTVDPVSADPNGAGASPSSMEMIFDEATDLPTPARHVGTIEKSMKMEELPFRPVAQIARSYIVAEGEEGLVLIDQHAAHERVRYARFMKALEEKQPLLQPLLLPLQLDLGAESTTLLQDHLEEFKAFGFEVESFGGNTFLLRAVPDGLQKRNAERAFLDVLNDVARDERQKILSLREALATSAACRGAIKFGDTLTLVEMEALLKDMANTPHYTHCPHGRPALVTWSYGKLEELFKRKNF